MSHVANSTCRLRRSRWMNARRSGDYGGPGGVHLFPRRIFSFTSPFSHYIHPEHIAGLCSCSEVLLSRPFLFHTQIFSHFLLRAMSSKPEAPDAWEEDWESQADVCVEMSSPLPYHESLMISELQCAVISKNCLLILHLSTETSRSAYPAVREKSFIQGHKGPTQSATS